jgi:hypothetical protein
MNLRLVRVVLTAELAILPEDVRRGLMMEEDAARASAERLVVNQVMDALTRHAEKRSPGAGARGG